MKSSLIAFWGQKERLIHDVTSAVTAVMFARHSNSQLGLQLTIIITSDYSVDYFLN